MSLKKALWILAIAFLAVTGIFIFLLQRGISDKHPVTVVVFRHTWHTTIETDELKYKGQDKFSHPVYSKEPGPTFLKNGGGMYPSCPTISDDGNTPNITISGQCSVRYTFLLQLPSGEFREMVVTKDQFYSIPDGTNLQANINGFGALVDIIFPTIP